MGLLKGIEDLVKSFTGENGIKSETVLRDGKFSKDVVPSFNGKRRNFSDCLKYLSRKDLELPYHQQIQ